MPEVATAISHKLKRNRPVDFGDFDVKAAAMEHVAKNNDPHTPFLSTSYSIDARVQNEPDINQSKIIARINLISMFNDGYFNVDSFVDLGNEIAFNQFFHHLPMA